MYFFMILLLLFGDILLNNPKSAAPPVDWDRIYCSEVSAGAVVQSGRVALPEMTLFLGHRSMPPLIA
jgi:hypothetical protein